MRNFPVNTPGMFEKALRDVCGGAGAAVSHDSKRAGIRSLCLETTVIRLSGCWKRKKETGGRQRFVLSASEKEQAPGGGRSRGMPAERRRLLRGIHILTTNIRRHRNRDGPEPCAQRAGCYNTVLLSGKHPEYRANIGRCAEIF